MGIFRKAWRRLKSLSNRRALDRELDEEVAFHLEMEARLHRDAGLDEAGARRRARIAFGPVQAFREATRDARGTTPLDDLLRDLRHGARGLGRRPGFTIAVLATLALGVGGSAAMFGVVDGILLAPLPYPNPDRIMSLAQRDRSSQVDRDVAPANFLDWRARSRSFATLTAMEPYGLDWLSPTGPVYLPTQLVYPGFFETFGVAPRLGRTFRPDEFVAGRDQVVVLGHAVWLTRFGGDPGVVGRTLTLDGKPMTVAGVMPASFRIPSSHVVWAPKVAQGWEARARTGGFYEVFGRLRAGVTVEQAREELTAIGRALAAEYPQNRQVGVSVVSLADRMVAGVRGPLVMLLGAVGLVFGIVLANVASLELARALGRGREFAVRRALGAGQGRMARQLVAESLCLAALGGGLGFAVARILIEAIQVIAPHDLPRLDELGASRPILGFSIIASLVAATITGLVPALLAGRRGGEGAGLVGGTRATTRPAVRRLQTSLVTAQIGLSLVLLVAAGLLIRSFAAVLSTDRGFQTDGVVVLTVQTWSEFPNPADRIRFATEVSARLAATPGVQGAAVTTSVPLMETIGAEQSSLVVEGAPPPTATEEPPTVSFAAVGPAFFPVLRIPLKAGRLLDDRDRTDAPPVVVVNEAFVQRHLDGRSPLGVRIQLGRTGNGTAISREIVGVVGDVRRAGLVDAPRPTVYQPHAQSGSGANAFLVRSTLSPSVALDRTRRVIAELAPAIAVYREATMDGLVGDAVRDRRFLLVVLGGFAVLALVLSGAGIFGLMSFLAEERVREIGVRMALGARRADVMAMILRFGGRLALFGILAGSIGAVAGTRLLLGMLYRVRPLDPASFAGAAVVLLAAALVASWVPAWRASRADPVDALRLD